MSCWLSSFTSFTLTQILMLKQLQPLCFQKWDYSNDLKMTTLSASTFQVLTIRQQYLGSENIFLRWSSSLARQMPLSILLRIVYCLTRWFHSQKWKKVSRSAWGLRCEEMRRLALIISCPFVRNLPSLKLWSNLKPSSLYRQATYSSEIGCCRCRDCCSNGRYDLYQCYCYSSCWAVQKESRINSSQCYLSILFWQGQLISDYFLGVVLAFVLKNFSSSLSLSHRQNYKSLSLSSLISRYSLLPLPPLYKLYLILISFLRLVILLQRSIVSPSFLPAKRYFLLEGRMSPKQ